MVLSQNDFCLDSSSCFYPLREYASFSSLKKIENSKQNKKFFHTNVLKKNEFKMNLKYGMKNRSNQISFNLSLKQ